MFPGSEKQAAVAELVPEVPLADRGVVGPLDQLRTGDRLQQQQVRGLRFVPAGDQPVHDLGRPVRPEDEVGPAAPRADRAVRLGEALQRARHRGADGDHPAAVLLRPGDQARRVLRYPEPLRLRRFVALQRGDARVQGDRGDCDPGRDQAGYQLGRERAPGAGHFRAARLPGEHGLVSGQRPPAPQVPVGDRPAVPGQVRRDRAGYLDPRPPQPVAARHRGEQRHRRAAGQRDPLTRYRVPDRTRLVRPARLDDPGPLLVERRGEVHDDRAGAHRGGHRGGRVDDQEVAGGEEPAQVVEARVPHRGTVRDQQPHLIPAQPATLGWLPGGQLGRQHEPGPRRGTHAVTSWFAPRGAAASSLVASLLTPDAAAPRCAHAGTARSATRYRPLGRSPSTSRSSAGTTVSGSGRSEMSSPGNACWCRSVRMSPGSNPYTLRSGRSAARTAVSWSSAAFAEPYPPQPGYGSTAASELTSTIRPPARVSAGSRSWISPSGASTFTSYTRASSASGKSASAGIGLGPSALALLTSRSRSPRPSTAAASAARCSGSATSPATATTRVQPASSRATPSRSGEPRASRTRVQPRAASVRARARPRPRDEPVISATGMPRVC